LPRRGRALFGEIRAHFAQERTDDRKPAVIAPDARGDRAPLNGARWAE
jgi:hypothetical protein